MSIHDQIARDRDRAKPADFDWKDLALFRDYYRGRHRSTVGPDQKRILRSLGGNRFADNLCRRIVRVVANRAELLGWAVADDADSAVADHLGQLWVFTKMADLSAEATVATVRDGNHAYGLAWVTDDQAPGPEGEPIVTDVSTDTSGRVVIVRERWWDGATGLFIAYGPDGRPTYAVKEWMEAREDAPRDIRRRNVYRRGTVQRFVQNGQGWRPNPLPGEPETGIVPWRRPDGRPLAIPFVHLANGSDDDTPYGASDLDGGVIGMQDQINDLQIDMVAAGRMTAFQMYTATGVAVEKDATGNPRPIAVGPGRMLQSESPTAAYGVLPAGDLSQLERAYRLKVEALANMTETPVHHFTGQFPSGDALFRADLPLEQRGENLIKSLAPAAAELAHRAVELANAFGGLGLDEDALITATFAPADRRDQAALVEINQRKADRMRVVESLETRYALREAGVPDKEIEAFLTQRQAARAGSAAALGGLFDQGVVGD